MMPVRQPNDRRVHASHWEGEEIVRHDRAGKWYIELVPPSRHAPLRKAVKIDEAVSRAIELVEQGGEVHLGLYGGGMFDHKYRNALRERAK
jgi:hypothetical protein